jgi:hypothetical protein
VGHPLPRPLDRTDRRVLVGSLVAIVLALALVAAYLGPRLLEIPPLEVLKVLLAIAAGLALGVPASWLRDGFPGGNSETKALGVALGLQAKRHSLHGTWKGRRVVVHLARDGGPAVVVGQEGEGRPLWDATERALEELLTPRKQAPVPTGDRAFDGRFVWRPRAGEAVLAAPVRKALLAGGPGDPDSVDVWSEGLSYHFGGDDESAPRLRAALDRASTVADALGLPRGEGEARRPG